MRIGTHAGVKACMNSAPAARAPSSKRGRLCITPNVEAKVTLNMALQRIAQAAASNRRQKPNDAGRSNTAVLLLLFHRRAAALDSSGAAFGDDDLRRTFATDINFAKLISH